MARQKFPMGGFGANANNMIKQAQKMQQEMLKAQEEIEQSNFEASAGGGAVEVKVNGKHEVLEVKIQPEVVDPDDVEILSDMIIAATNEAIRKAADTMEQKMGSVTSGLNLPAGFGF